MTAVQETLMPGARVHYVRDSSGDLGYPRVCRAALVTEIYALWTGNADLVVFDSEGFRNKHNVAWDGTLSIDGGPAGGTWHWPDPESARCTAVTGRTQ